MLPTATFPRGYCVSATHFGVVFKVKNFKMQINKRQLKEWIAALDSGEYKQTKGKLNNKHGYCCLGVACAVLVPKKLLDMDGEFIAYYLPASQSRAPFWLREINKDFYRKTDRTLAQLNDGYGFSFTEIATMLELVYIHKMLD